MNFFDRKLKIWQFLLIMVSIAAIVCFLLYKCGKPVSNPTEKPHLKPDTEIKKEIVYDSAESKRKVDSVSKIIKKIDNILTVTTNNYLNAQDKILFLQQENDSLLSLQAASDLANSITDKAQEIRQQIKTNDSLCNLNIASLESILRQQRVIQSECDSLYNKLRSSTDTALKNQKILTAISKLDSINNKPRNKLYLGPATNVWPVAGVGAGFSFVHKKGWVLDADILRMNREWYVPVSFKFLISTRRKK